MQLIILYCCWYKPIQQKPAKFCIYGKCEKVITTTVMLANRIKNTIQNPSLPSGVCVFVHVCTWAVRKGLYGTVCGVWESQCTLSVKVVSARRGNLLYKQRADVSYVYPCSHSTKEPCIPSHPNPGPRLSWFSDINNFLFHFPYFLLPVPFSAKKKYDVPFKRDLNFWPLNWKEH